MAKHTVLLLEISLLYLSGFEADINYNPSQISYLKLSINQHFSIFKTYQGLEILHQITIRRNILLVELTTAMFSNVTSIKVH